MLLDTCAAIWLMNGDHMTAESREAIAAAQVGGLVHVSPITAWEIATLAARGRLAPGDEPGARGAVPRATESARRRAGADAADILMASATLPGAPPRDPADCIIAATARSYRQAIVTRDGELIPYASAGHIQAIGC